MDNSSDSEQESWSGGEQELDELRVELESQAAEVQPWNYQPLRPESAAAAPEAEPQPEPERSETSDDWQESFNHCIIRPTKSLA